MFEEEGKFRDVRGRVDGPPDKNSAHVRRPIQIQCYHYYATKRTAANRISDALIVASVMH
jgi:hypothetical protein